MLSSSIGVDASFPFLSSIINKKHNKTMRPDQHQVQKLLVDTVTLICRNGLQYKKGLKVQGLLGITLDDSDVFVVHIDKLYDEAHYKAVAASTDTEPDPVKVSNIPPLTDGHDHPDSNHYSASYYDSICDNVALGKANNIHITNIPPSTAVDDYESTDGSDKLVIADDIPVIKSLHTSINRKPGGGVAKKTTSNKGVKRPSGAAKRKESRSVRQRLSSSFVHHNTEEPPEDLVIDIPHGNGTPDCLSDDEHAMNSLYNSKPSTNHTRVDPLRNYEVDDYDSHSLGKAAATKTNSQESRVQEPETEDMIECLLYNERVEQGEESSAETAGIYKRVHISGAEDSMIDRPDEADLLAGCSAWEDSQDTSFSKGAINMSSGSPSALDESVTYSGIQRQDINESLVSQYKDLLEAAAVQGDGYPCVECDQILKTRAIWMEHMKGVHMNRKYACPHCGETFKWRSSRKRHMLISHSNETEMDAGTPAGPPAEETDGSM